MSAALSAEAVTYRVGTRALVDDVTVRVCAGELVALIGPNGAGKSTLLALLAGDLAPHAGRVQLQGRPVRRIRAGELARLRGVMPQATAVELPFTAAEVVAMGRHPWPPEGGAAERARVEASLERTDALPLAARAMPTLSGGERARVVLARLLAQDPAVVLLDEPTASLDMGHQEACMRLARELARAGRAVVAVVHDLNLAAAHADRLVLMHGGRLVATGPPWQVLTPERVAGVFGVPVHVAPHPCRDCPLVVAAPGGAAA